ncbi:hypothetical protein L6164_034141 [Bauhinia variegata]|uniref:Uncharacterized protein n=1 Tax=Bauhinia variegata TaxID=167791 RepID=A0ACB9KU45_BAUVA|nr:hypothetical protein L6164_034141 [Bauhinia variegata]
MRNNTCIRHQNQSKYGDGGHTKPCLFLLVAKLFLETRKLSMIALFNGKEILPAKMQVIQFLRATCRLNIIVFCCCKSKARILKFMFRKFPSLSNKLDLGFL